MYSINNIQEIIKGKWLQQAGDNTIEQLVLDSRKILFHANSLFFALKGPRRNGHAFLQDAYDKGVRNFVVYQESAVPVLANANILLVKDSLQALQQLAIYHRRQFTLPVIGITGSNGKTIVKEWLNQLLEEKYIIVRSPKSYNSQTGVPLSIWQINASHTLALFEAGISQSDEMQRLEKMIQPTIGVFTNIGEAHNEGFLHQRQKAREKMQLFKQVQTLIYCSDYPEINEALADLVQNIRNQPANKLNLFSWSLHTNATLKVTSLLKDDRNTFITAEYQEKEISFKIPFIDDASIENAITCYCVLLYLELPSDEITKRILQLNTVAMRLELKKGINNCSIINDSYSADLSSLKIALDFLATQQQHQRKTVILSDILQTGKSDNALYQLVAAALEQKKVDRFIGIGPQLIKHRQFFESIPHLESVFFEHTQAFKKGYYQLRFQNETILLKGARVFAFEQIMPLLEQKVHQTILEINLSSMRYNLLQYQQLLKPGTKMMLMVKAFSYGSGSYEIASQLQFHKVDYLAVAYADEGIELRKGGITLPIMIMNPEPNTFDALLQYQLEPDIYSFELLRLFNDFLNRESIPAFPIHIEFETGMNRLGFNCRDIAPLAKSLLSGACKVQSVFTHLAASEDPEMDAFTLEQGRLFSTACDQLSNALQYTFIKHIANSAAIVRFPALEMDMVRLGIGLYGIDSVESSKIKLIEVATLKTTIAQIKYLKAGETVGYGRKGLAAKDTVIATVRLGYADGYPRRLGNGKGSMLLNGKQVPVIGAVCMDMTMLDITDVADVQEGDKVVVYGENLSVAKLAEWAATIPYEIMTGISQRVKRVYFEE